MVKAVFDESSRRNRRTTLPSASSTTSPAPASLDREFSTESPDDVRAVFYGLGADGTVGANKNSIKIIGEDTDYFAQGYFVYDSKKSGSHDGVAPALRAAADPLDVPDHAGEFRRLPPVRVRGCARCSGMRQPGVPPSCSIVLTGRTTVWDHLPVTMQQELILDKKLKFFVINADPVAQDSGNGAPHQHDHADLLLCVSAVCCRARKLLPRSRKAIDQDLQEARRCGRAAEFRRGGCRAGPFARGKVPAIVHQPSATRQPLGAGHGARFCADGDGAVSSPAKATCCRSALPVDGTFPTGPPSWEKRTHRRLEMPRSGIRRPVYPVRNKCVLVCPHRQSGQRFTNRAVDCRPQGASDSSITKPKWKEFEKCSNAAGRTPGLHRLQSCACMVCPAKSKTDVKHKAINMEPQAPLRVPERENWDFFLSLPEANREQLKAGQVKDVQLFAAAVRVLRGLRRLRRDALPQADDAALRRPRSGRQRHRLLVDLRRQSPHRYRSTLRAAVRCGRILFSRTTLSSAWACGWP